MCASQCLIAVQASHALHDGSVCKSSKSNPLQLAHLSGVFANGHTRKPNKTSSSAAPVWPSRGYQHAREHRESIKHSFWFGQQPWQLLACKLCTLLCIVSSELQRGAAPGPCASAPSAFAAISMPCRRPAEYLFHCRPDGQLLVIVQMQLVKDRDTWRELV